MNADFVAGYIAGLIAAWFARRLNRWLDSKTNGGAS